jgi:hypothetical protein
MLNDVMGGALGRMAAQQPRPPHDPFVTNCRSSSSFARHVIGWLGREPKDSLDILGVTLQPTPMTTLRIGERTRGPSVSNCIV